MVVPIKGDIKKTNMARLTLQTITVDIQNARLGIAGRKI